jgi:hypothetical protein
VAVDVVVASNTKSFPSSVGKSLFQGVKASSVIKRPNPSGSLQARRRRKMPVTSVFTTDNAEKVVARQDDK